MALAAKEDQEAILAMLKGLSADKKTRQGCPYSGYTVYAGEFVPSAESDFADYFECGYKVYIGPKKYFVTSDVGDGRGATSVHADDARAP